MLVQLNAATVINMRKLISTGVSINRTTKKEKCFTFFGLFPSERTIEKEEWQLNIKYICGNSNKEIMAYWTCPNRSELEQMVQVMMKQIKASNSDMVDKAFEDAFLKDT